MSRSENSFSFYLLSVLIAAALPAQVLAQEGGDRLSTLEEIIVTAQKREEFLQETPIAISVFSEDDLQAMGVFEAGQVGNYTPNVQINRQPGSMDNYGYAIRGVGSGETSLLVENTVGVYVDGIYISRNTGAVFDIVDLERVEVLRGPQGTLYGRNTIGGAVNLITAKPAEEFGFQQQFSVGNRDFFRSSTSIDTGDLGGFAAKFSYNHNEKDGLVNNTVHGNRLGEQESDAFRAALRWMASENLTLDYTFDKSERESNAALSQIVHVREPNSRIGGAITRQAAAFADPDRLGGLPMPNAAGKDTNSDIDAHSLTVEWAVNDSMIFKSITSYREWESGTTGTDFGGFPADGATVLAGPTGTFVPAGELVSTFLATRESDNEQFTQEFQLIGDAMDEKLQYTLGLYYFEEESNEDNPQSFVLPAEFAFGQLPRGTKSFLCADPTFQNEFACVGKDAVLASPIFQYGSENESIAAYGQLTYAATDQLDVTVGVRYTEDDKKAYLRQSQIEGGVPTNKADDDWDNISPALTLNYHWSDDVSTYATYSTGYRSGGFAARSTSAEIFANGFDEEEVTNYEIGIKSDWLDSRLRINAAVFYLEYDDAQVNSFEAGEGGASSVTNNAGELETKGFEIELTALPFAGARIIATYGYLDAAYQEYITQRVDPVTSLPDPGPNADPLTGNEDVSDVAVVGRSPEHSGSLVFSYDFEPFSFGRLSARLEATYVDDMVFHPQLNRYDSTDDQTLVNARVTLSDMELLGGNLQVSAWGRNLNDEEYREWGIDFAALGIVINSFQEKRSYGLDLIYRYGN